MKISCADFHVPLTKYNRHNMLDEDDLESIIVQIESLSIIIKIYVATNRNTKLILFYRKKQYRLKDKDLSSIAIINISKENEDFRNDICVQNQNIVVAVIIRHLDRRYHDRNQLQGDVPNGHRRVSHNGNSKSCRIGGYELEQQKKKSINLGVN